MINFASLQKVYNTQMNSLLATDGLTTKVTFNFGITKRDICPNCIYDPNLRKSANKYKTGGPMPFAVGRICPYCNGAGFHGEENSSTGYLAVIWDYKKWINPPPDIASPDGMIQTISNKSYLSNIRQCKDLSVEYSTANKQPKFVLYNEPTPAGLGDNDYIIAMWKKSN